MYGSLMDAQEQQANTDESQTSLQDYYCLAEDFNLTCMQRIRTGESITFPCKYLTEYKEIRQGQSQPHFFLMASLAIIHVLTISVQLHPLKNKYSDIFRFRYAKSDRYSQREDGELKEQW